MPSTLSVSRARAQVAHWLFFEQENVMSGIGSARFRALTGRPRPLSCGLGMDRADYISPGFIEDFARYPDNARPGQGQSIYD